MSTESRVRAVTFWAVVRTALVIWLLALPAWAQTFDEAHAAAVKNNPTGVAFDLTLPQKTFYMGEIIAVTLAFSSTEKDRWQLDGGLYDRCGRLYVDTYCLDPADGASDPLVDYFDGGGMSGGIRSVPVLTAKPYVMKFDLNEWQRIDRPGKYRLYVISHRLTDLGQSPGPQRLRGLPMVSNVVDFEVLPADPLWQQGQLDQVRKALDAAKGDEARPLARRLRFLGTPESAPELARRFNGSEADGDCMFGLYGLRDRAAAIQAMHERFLAPDHPVTSMFLETLAHLQALQADTTPRLPSTAPGAHAAYAQRRERWNAASDQAVGELADAIGQKVGTAKAVSVLTLLETPRKLPEHARQTLRAILPAVFAHLPPERQSQTLKYDWRAVESPAMLPVLLGLYRQLLEDPKRDSYSVAERIDACLQRAYELNPDQVRPVILAALQDPRGKFDAHCMQSLLMLPDATLPELDEIWTTTLEGHPSGPVQLFVTRLLARYSTATPLARIKTLYAETPHSYCEVQPNFLAYFLRVDPAYGQAQVRARLADRGHIGWGCGATLIEQLPERVWTPEIEAVCVETLVHPDVAVVRQAAVALTHHASAPIKEKMLAALEAPWTTAPPRAKDPTQPKDLCEAREFVLVRALTAARAWLLSDAELSQVEKLVTSAEAKDCLARHRQARQGKISVQLETRSSGEIWANLLATDLDSLAALEAKMLQFPQGTIFTLGWSGPEDQDPARKALRVWAHEKGVTVEK